MKQEVKRKVVPCTLYSVQNMLYSIQKIFYITWASTGVEILMDECPDGE